MHGVRLTSKMLAVIVDKFVWSVGIFEITVKINVFIGKLLPLIFVELLKK